MAKELAKQGTAEIAEPVDERPSIPPAVDIYENPEEYLLIADVPGVKSNAVKLHLEEGQLILRAARGEHAEYKRAFYLPDGVDFGKAAANMDRGVLSIHLPKSSEAKPRRIKVKQL